MEWLQQRQLGRASVVITRDLYARSARIPRPLALDRWGRVIRGE
jgi:hypothetical protein